MATRSLRATIVLLSLVAAFGCSNETGASAGGSGGGGSGAAGTSGTAGSAGSNGTACEPDDGVAEAPCGALQCNGKCFPTSGPCRAGCQRVGTARNTYSVLFEGGYAYHYNSSTLDRIDLATYQSERLPATVLGFSNTVVKDGVVYWYAQGSLNRSEIGGTPTTLLTTDTSYFDDIAELDGTIYLLDSLDWYSIPTAAPAANAIMSAFGDIPFSMGYDDQYLYLSGHLAGINDGSHTYRATGANIGVPEEICDGIAQIEGRIYGDYFYRWGIEVPTVYRRCPKTGGVFTDFATVPSPFRDFVAKGDALYGLDDDGNLHRIRSSTDSTIIARIDPLHANTVVTDGTHVYLPTGSNVDGALFRIIE
jgi:hypothetical protein